MIAQKYINILDKQRLELIEQKKSANFFTKLFFRKYTDWILTDIVETLVYQNYTHYGYKIGDPHGEHDVQIQIRMKISNGEIERSHIRI